MNETHWDCIDLVRNAKQAATFHTLRWKIEIPFMTLLFLQQMMIVWRIVTQTRAGWYYAVRPVRITHSVRTDGCSMDLQAPKQLVWHVQKERFLIPQEKSVDIYQVHAQFHGSLKVTSPHIPHPLKQCKLWILTKWNGNSVNSENLIILSVSCVILVYGNILVSYKRSC